MKTEMETMLPHRDGGTHELRGLTSLSSRREAHVNSRDSPSNLRAGRQSKVALVTGAGRGMGRSVALALANLGYRLAVNDVSPMADDTAQEIVQLGGTALAVRADVANERAVCEMVATVIEELDSIDVLINNAGILRPTKIVDISEQEWDLVVNINLKSTFLCTKQVLPHMMRRQWGRIINFSSSAGKNVSTLGGAHYTAAKAAILGLTRHTAMEAAPFGITVNAVCPGLINTEMVRSEIEEIKLRKLSSQFPVPRLGNPDEVAELVSFLVSEQAAYITGASVDINGGTLMV